MSRGCVADRGGGRLRGRRAFERCPRVSGEQREHLEEHPRTRTEVGEWTLPLIQEIGGMTIELCKSAML